MWTLPFQAFDSSSTIEIHNRTLPHWQQVGCTYFVTFRLADSLPQEKLRQWRVEHDAWLRKHPAPHTDEEQREFHERFSERMQQWLDAGYGECWLRGPDISAVVEEALKHFSGERYELSAYVIMPNHVDVLVTPNSGWRLDRIIHSWKSYTANQINNTLDRSGTVWQDEYFDHVVRYELSLDRFAEYIRQNPSQAGLRDGEYRCNAHSE
jgi:REP element-mobilizing transposase RayT